MPVTSARHLLDLCLLANMHSDKIALEAMYALWSGWLEMCIKSSCMHCRVTYTVETMKNGSIVEQRDINQKSHYIFGRTDACDFQLEHPSISRVHAVLQLSSNGTSSELRKANTLYGPSYCLKQSYESLSFCCKRIGEAFLYDAGSAHGTFLNKQKLKPQVHVPLRYAYADYLICIHTMKSILLQCHPNHCVSV